MKLSNAQHVRVYSVFSRREVYTVHTYYKCTDSVGSENPRYSSVQTCSSRCRRLNEPFCSLQAEVVCDLMILLLTFQGYNMSHTLQKWLDLGFLSHWVILGTYIFHLMV